LDKELMRRTGRDLAESYVRHPPLSNARTEAALDRAEALV
jgi:hypothetical protein